MRAWWRRRRASNAGYRAGIVGRSHNEMPHYETLDESMAWAAGWYAGHRDWMVEAASR